MPLPRRTPGTGDFHSDSTTHAAAPEPIGAWWLAAAVGVVLLATLPPEPEWAGARPEFFALPLPLRRGVWIDVLQNIALYVPLGVALGARTRRRGLVGLVAAALSLFTELLQFRVPGRDPSGMDVITNTVGALIGWSLVRTHVGAGVTRLLAAFERRAGRVLHPACPAAAVLSFAWAAAVAGMFLATGWLLSAAPPEPFFYAVSGPSLDDIPGPLRIGSSGGRGGLFRGLIDEVRIYEGALSVEAIRADMQRPVSGSPHQDGLVAAYGFDEGSGFSARDGTGHGHTAVLQGTAWDRGRFGGALFFDGASARVTVARAPAFDLRRGMTLEAWIFPAGVPAFEASVVAHAADAYYLRASSDAAPLLAAAGGRFGGAPGLIRLRQPLPADEWTHLAATYDNQAIRVFVNGELAGERRRWSPHEAVSAVLDETVDLVPGFVPDPRDLRTRLLGDFVLDITVRCGPPHPGAAPVFLVTGAGNVEVMAVAAAGVDLRVRSATMARRFGLASPDYHVPGVFRDCAPGREVAIRLTGPLDKPRIVRGGDPSGEVRPGAGSLWAVVIHSELLPQRVVSAVSLAWLAAWALPFGYWARRSLWTAGGIAMLGAARYGATSLWALPPPDPFELTALLAGMTTGFFVRRS